MRLSIKIIALLLISNSTKSNILFEEEFVITIFKLFKEKRKSKQAQIDKLYADISEIEENLEKDKDYQEINENEYETVRYDKIEQDNQEYIEITE